MRLNSVEMMHRPDRTLFNVLIAPQTYKNIAYLLVGFPLALTYFIMLVAGLSAGFSLIVVGIGLFVLWLTFFMSRGFMTAQRELAVGFLGRRLKELPEAAEPTGAYEQFIKPLFDPFTWKMVAYLLTNFVLSTFAFTLTVSLLATTVGLLMAPMLYQLIPIWGGTMSIPGVIAVDSILDTVWLVTFGIGFGTVSLHITNALAQLSVRQLQAVLR